jgi:hypothetical protein
MMKKKMTPIKIGITRTGIGGYRPELRPMNTTTAKNATCGPKNTSGKTRFW